jgi:hypothetical protein
MTRRDEPRRDRFRITGPIWINESPPPPAPPTGQRVRRPPLVTDALRAHDQRLAAQGREFNAGAYGDE